MKGLLILERLDIDIVQSVAILIITTLLITIGVIIYEIKKKG